MEELLALYYSFWSNIIPYKGGFMDAYPAGMAVNSKGEPLDPAYITYDPILGAYGQDTMQVVRIWENTLSTTLLGRYTDAVLKEVPESGRSLLLPSRTGAISIWRGNPFVQIIELPDDKYSLMKNVYINVVVRPFIL